jgi:hypothetical protein
MWHGDRDTLVPVTAGNWFANHYNLPTIQQSVSSMSRPMEWSAEMVNSSAPSTSLSTVSTIIVGRSNGSDNDSSRGVLTIVTGGSHMIMKNQWRFIIGQCYLPLNTTVDTPPTTNALSLIHLATPQLVQSRL